jgi:hypothetical protein
LENRDIRAINLPRPHTGGPGLSSASDLSCNMPPFFLYNGSSGVLADPILTAVHDDCLTGDEGGIVACQEQNRAGDGQVHYVYYTPELEAARSKGGLRTN